MTSMAPGNEFAAPSTASFGDSNEENVEDMTINRQFLVPATVASPEAQSVNSMADMIGNATASANSTPLSYEMVTMSPEKDEQKTRQEREIP